LFIAQTKICLSATIRLFDLHHRRHEKTQKSRQPSAEVKAHRKTVSRGTID
jgi:hypothetical protein